MHVEISVDGPKNHPRLRWQVVRLDDHPFTGTKRRSAAASEEFRTITDESDFDGPLVDYRPRAIRSNWWGRKSWTTSRFTG